MLDGASEAYLGINQSSRLMASFPWDADEVDHVCSVGQPRNLVGTHAKLHMHALMYATGNM